MKVVCNDNQPSEHKQDYLLKIPENLKIKVKNSDTTILDFKNDIEITKNDRIIALVGSSGCGKTTLLNLIYNEKAMNYYNIINKIDRKNTQFKFIPHNHAYNPYLTVRELIYQWSGNKISEDDIMPIANDIGLSEHLNKYIGDTENKILSSGELARLSILLQTINIDKNKNTIVILDEPLSNVDSESCTKILKYLKGLNIPILFSLHNPPIGCVKYIDRIIQIKKENNETIICDSVKKNNYLELLKDIFKLDNVDNNEIKNFLIKIIESESINENVNNNSSNIIENLNVNYQGQIINSINNAFVIFYRDKKFLLSNLIFTIFNAGLYLLFFYGSNFGENSINGYTHMINLINVIITVMSITHVLAIIKYSDSYNFVIFAKHNKIINNFIFNIVYWFFISILLALQMFINILVLCSLNENNILMLSYLSKYLLSYSIFKTYLFGSFCYILNNRTYIFLLVLIYISIYSLNNGLFGISYEQLQYFNPNYYMYNIISVISNDIYDYPMLPNENNTFVPVYDIYGYKNLSDNDIFIYDMYILLIYLSMIFLFYFIGRFIDKNIFLS